MSSGQGAGALGYRGLFSSVPAEGVSSFCRSLRGPCRGPDTPMQLVPPPLVPEVKPGQDTGSSHSGLFWAGCSAGAHGSVARGSWSRPLNAGI